MKKEAHQAEKITSSDLEKKLGLGVRDACGLKVRTFDCINDLENISEIRKATIDEGGSGFIRADVMNAFYSSMHELMEQCETYFAAHGKPDMEELVNTFPEKDHFLKLLNEKKFDGIHEYAEDTFRKKQYRQIKEAYFTDRESVVNGVYIQHLKKGRQKKRRWLPYVIGIPIAAFLLAGSAAQIATYFTANELKNEARKEIHEARKEIQSTKEEFYSTVSRLEQNLQPENIIKSAEDYFKSKEGQEYVSIKYVEFKEWWAKEDLAADQLDAFWEKNVRPALDEFNSPESDQRRAKYIVDLLEQEYGLKTTVEEITRIFGKKKKD